VPHWATAVLAVETQTSEPVPESLVQPGRGRVLASSRLLDAGDGGGRLWLLERDAWGEASATRPGEGRQLRAFRIREALVAEGAAAPADGWYVSAAADLGRAALQFDDPAVAGAIRRTLAGYLPLLGRRLVATSTLMSDWRRCAGALTVFEAGRRTRRKRWLGTIPGGPSSRAGSSASSERSSLGCPRRSARSPWLRRCQPLARRDVRLVDCNGRMWSRPTARRPASQAAGARDGVAQRGAHLKMGDEARRAPRRRHQRPEGARPRPGSASPNAARTGCWPRPACRTTWRRLSS
jgi:hypothetical protein